MPTPDPADGRRRQVRHRRTPSGRPTRRGRQRRVAGRTPRPRPTGADCAAPSTARRWSTPSSTSTPRATSARAPTRSRSGPGSPPARSSATSRTPTTWPARPWPDSRPGCCPCSPVEATPDDPFADRVAALVAQRLRLFATLGKAAHVSRLRAPFQPRLAEGLAQGRRFLRGQVQTLFARELAAPRRRPGRGRSGRGRRPPSFETYQLLTEDRGFDSTRSGRC